MYRKHVSSRDVAANPVAKALAKKRLREAITDQKIRIYLSEEGEPSEDIIAGIGSLMGVVCLAAEIDGLGETPDNKILRGGVSTCQQMVDAGGAWRKSNTVAIDRALDAAIDLNDLISADAINVAWHALHEAAPVAMPMNRAQRRRKKAA